MGPGAWAWGIIRGPSKRQARGVQSIFCTPEVKLGLGGERGGGGVQNIICTAPGAEEACRVYFVHPGVRFGLVTPNINSKAAAGKTSKEATGQPQKKTKKNRGGGHHRHQNREKKNQ